MSVLPLHDSNDATNTGTPGVPYHHADASEVAMVGNGGSSAGEVCEPRSLIMAKLATSPLAKFWATKVSSKTTTVKMEDEQMTLVVKAEGGVKSTSSADVADFLKSQIAVKVQNKGQDEAGQAVNQSGISSGKDTAAAYLANVEHLKSAANNVGKDEGDGTPQGNGHASRIPA